MVQKDSSISGDENSPTKEIPTPELPVNTAKGIPNGKYHLVGWAADVTGGRLIDEICQLASFTPKSQFSQYIMPYTNFTPSYSYRHSIRIVNTVKYRRLKNLRTKEFVKTKSEISALVDFIQSLEEVKGDSSDGIILIYHEAFKCSPGKLLESVKRYHLLDRFSNVVKGFANVHNIAQLKCANTTKSFSLHTLSKVLLNTENADFSSAVDRAKASYDIAVHFAQGERQELDAKASGDCTGVEPHIIDFICPFTNPVSVEEEEMANWRELMGRQNTFLPIFGVFLSASSDERFRAKYLQRLLAENNLTFDKLHDVYNSKAKDGLESVINEAVANAKDNDLTELVEILDSYFDPNKKSLQPKRFNNKHHKRIPRTSYRSKNSISESNSANNASSDNPTDSMSNPESPRSETKAVEEQLSVLVV